MYKTQRRHESVSIDPLRPPIKFKTITRQCLPYLQGATQTPSICFDKFEKKQVDKCWRDRAHMRKQLSLWKLEEKQSQNSQIQRLKKQLKNEGSALLMKKKNMEKRLEANMLIRVAMKQIANKQEQLINGKNYSLQSI